MTSPTRPAHGLPDTSVPSAASSWGDDDASVVALVADDVEGWLENQEQTRPSSALYWAPCHWQHAEDWVEVRGVEQLAVLISTAVRSDNNVCFVSGTPGRQGRSANAIGLISRPVTGWAVVLNEGGEPAGDVQRVGYAYDNYDSFAALHAAEICAAWVVTGTLPEGLETRPRDR